jgi:hypothetical protein
MLSHREVSGDKKDFPDYDVLHSNHQYIITIGVCNNERRTNAKPAYRGPDRSFDPSTHSGSAL